MLGTLCVSSFECDFLSGAVYYAQDSLLFRLDRNGFVFFMIGNLLTGLSHVLPAAPSISIIYLVLYTSLSVFLALHTCVRLQSMLSAVCRGDYVYFIDIFSEDKEDTKKNSRFVSLPQRAQAPA